MGRPTKLTPETQKLICEQLRKCGTLEDAAAVAGVDSFTIRRWRAKGLEQKTGPYRAFCAAVDRALHDRRVAREQLLVDHGEQDWRAMAWLMERTEPKRYAPRVRVHVEEELTHAIERLTEAFADRPDVLELALSALAGADRSGEAASDPLEAGGADDPGREAVQPAPAE